MHAPTPGLAAECHSVMLAQCTGKALDFRDDLSKLRAHVPWWLELPAAPVPRVHSLQTCAGLLRMHTRRLASSNSDQVMRLACEWGTPTFGA